uniref:Uncharacterized protein n=1 Tax=Megaselia scalaris TaxID=36166 RepID=T1GA87_MEGSC
SSYQSPSISYGYRPSASVSFNQGQNLRPSGSYSYSFGTKGGSGLEIPTNFLHDLTGIASGSTGKQKFVFEGGDIKEDTLAFLEHSRFQLPPLGSCRESLKLPLNVQYSCQDGINTCKLTCKNNYYFPEGLSSLNIVCMNGKWIIEGVEWS